MPQELPNLSELSLRLRNSNPEIWDAFLVKIDEYYQDLMFKVVQAPPEEVMVAQGRAQSAYALLRIFKECALEKKRTPLPPDDAVSADRSNP